MADRRLPVEYERGREEAMTQPASSIEKTENESQASLHSAHVVMVGVPAEIAVAISVASFLIGAALTGMLCCIHHRKAMPKSVSFDFAKKKVMKIEKSKFSTGDAEPDR